MSCKRFIVHGKVQGVGFRAYTRAVAEHLGISGEVWNRKDGKVELVACHETEAMMTELEFRLERGPGRVDRISIESQPDFNSEGFNIGLTR